jgi:hypothetical protein
MVCLDIPLSILLALIVEALRKLVLVVGIACWFRVRTIFHVPPHFKTGLQGPVLCSCLKKFLCLVKPFMTEGYQNNGDILTRYE